MATATNGTSGHHHSDSLPAQPDSRIAIIGARVGGLVTALQLHAHGFKNISLSLFEAAAHITSLGKLKNGTTTIDLEIRSFLIIEGNSPDMKVPQFSIHRGKLQILLLDAVRERLGEASVNLNHCLSSFSLSGNDTVELYFIQRKTSPLKEIGSGCTPRRRKLSSEGTSALYPGVSEQLMWCPLWPQMPRNEPGVAVPSSISFLTRERLPNLQHVKIGEFFGNDIAHSKADSEFECGDQQRLRLFCFSLALFEASEAGQARPASPTARKDVREDMTLFTLPVSLPGPERPPTLCFPSAKTRGLCSCGGGYVLTHDASRDTSLRNTKDDEGLALVLRQGQQSQPTSRLLHDCLKRAAVGLTPFTTRHTVKYMHSFEFSARDGKTYFSIARRYADRFVFPRGLVDVGEEELTLPDEQQRGFRDLHVPENPSPEISKRAIARLRRQKFIFYRAANHGESQTSCTVCLDDFTNASTVIRHDCKHVFHAKVFYHLVEEEQ
ncbi:hypothetical protein AC579_6923 [Pseudocercospora musae]|uniref:C2H2-type domain-containing protein n=1 Tax=Pseudocercospora musae TaxID=113226 RepID=A0A139HZS2_9PEZI|nr:hypothetical protein AC579_6923 [Pseudocercospora musae]